MSTESETGTVEAVRRPFVTGEELDRMMGIPDFAVLRPEFVNEDCPETPRGLFLPSKVTNLPSVIYSCLD